jgi:RNA polymerase sigma-70 factor (ECF subfamily)
LASFFRRGEVEQRALRRLGVQRRPLENWEYDRIEQLAGFSQMRAQIDVTLAGLGEDQREAIKLRVLEERSYPEVARALGVSEQTARARVSRALRALRASSTLTDLQESPDHA